MAASFGLVAGLVIVLRSPSHAVALALLPVVVGVALLVARHPAYLGIFLILAFYTNLESLLSVVLGLPFGDALFSVSVAYIAILIFSQAERPVFGAPVRVYFLFFFVSMIVIALSPYTREFAFANWAKRTAYGQITFVVAYMTLANQKRFRTVVVLLSWSGVILAIFNLIEFFDRSIIDFSSLPGRSAGLLLNPNVSAAAILSSFVLSYFYPTRFAVLSRIVMFAGIYTTFSRFALIVFWPLVAYLELRSRKLTLRQLTITAVLAAGIGVLTAYSAILMEDYSSAQVQKAYGRIAHIREGRFDDASSLQRIRVIFVNLDRFAEHPFIGGGLGSASLVDSPHNEFLLLMAELGILPTVFYVLFLALLFVRILRVEPREERQILMVTFVYAASYLLFTHNALNIKFHLILFSILCVATELFPRRRAWLDPWSSASAEAGGSVGRASMGAFAEAGGGGAGGGRR